MISPTHWIMEYYQCPPAPFLHDRQEQTVFKSSGLCRRQKEQADLLFPISLCSAWPMSTSQSTIRCHRGMWVLLYCYTGNHSHSRGHGPWVVPGAWSAAWPHETIYFIFDIGNILPSAPAPGAHWHLINTNTGSRVIDRYFQSSDWGHKRPFQWSFYVLPLQWFCSPT